MSRSSLDFCLPDHYESQQLPISSRDLIVSKDTPSVVWEHIKEVIPRTAHATEFVVFFYIRSHQLQPFAINYFLDRMIAPEPNTPTARLFKVVRLINFVRRMVLELGSWQGKSY